MSNFLRYTALAIGLIGASAHRTACLFGAPVPNVAFFGFQLINTSLEPMSPAEDQRITILDELFKERLANSGQFKIVPIPPRTAETNCRRSRDQRVQRLRA